MLDLFDPLLWIVLVISIGFSFLFSAAEAAFHHVSWSKVKLLAAGGNVRAAKVAAFAQKERVVMATALFGDTLADVLAATITTVLFAQYFTLKGVFLSVAVVFTLLLVIGEIAPKAIGRERPEKLLLLIQPILQGAITLFKPFTWLIVRGEKRISRWVRPHEDALEVDEELITIVTEAQSEGDMDEQEGELIRSAIEFRDLDALDILTPRVDIVGVNITSTMEETTLIFKENEFTRLPVYKENMDKIMGVLHQKDFFLALNDGETNLERVMKPVLFAPSTLKISKLLHLLQNNKTHLVIIVDEFGGTEGLVTMEDILEELVGEIYDEHDDVQEDMSIDAQGNYLVDGSMDLEEVLEQFNIPDTYETDTVAGWVAEVMERIPAVGESFELEQVMVVITQGDRKRVNQVKIIDKKDEKASGPNK